MPFNQCYGSVACQYGSYGSKSHKQLKRFFLLFLLDDRRIRICTCDYQNIRIRFHNTAFSVFPLEAALFPRKLASHYRFNNFLALVNGKAENYVSGLGSTNTIWIRSDPTFNTNLVNLANCFWSGLNKLYESILQTYFRAGSVFRILMKSQWKVVSGSALMCRRSKAQWESLPRMIRCFKYFVSNRFRI